MAGQRLGGGGTSSGQAAAEPAPHRLAGGNAGGAVRVGDTVRRPSGPWTPAVHALLAHLAGREFPGSPRPLGTDDQGREVLTFVPGRTVGDRSPWPAWTHSETTLLEVARWLRAYHRAVADFVPPRDAVWREGGEWRPGLIVGHNDAAPYNAVWASRLVGFIDWDLATPVSREWDVAFVAFGWVPLHARVVVEHSGFQDFAAVPHRLRRFLDEYGWQGTASDFLDVVRARIAAQAANTRRLAVLGEDPLFVRMVEGGVVDNLDRALHELDGLRF